MYNRRGILKSTSASLLASAFTATPLIASVIPKVSDEFRIQTRRRVEKRGRVIVDAGIERWKASETAIIICDMWQEHPCKLAQYRADRMAGKMNEVVSRARDHGVAIIHAPSGGMNHYQGTSYRQRMQQAQYYKPPVPIQGWCYHNSEYEGQWPIVDDVRLAKGAVTGCDDPLPRAHKDHDRHQNKKIKIVGFDGVSDDGQEIFNFIEQEGRKNIVLMGVHTNMCVLGRPFGIRQQRYLSKNVVLCRDLTDALYDPRDPPHVSHAQGVQLVIQHIEEFWCASILGDDLMTAVTP